MAFIQLERERYDSVKKLFVGKETAFRPSAFFILEGVVDGVVYVDDRTQPKCAAMMSRDYVGGRLVGDASDAVFNEGFVSTMREHFQAARDNGKDLNLFWSAVSETWEALIFRIFGYRIFRIDRTQFEFDRNRYEDLGAVDPDASFRRIDAEVIASNASLKGEIEGLWGSVENYLAHSLGWVYLSQDGDVAGRCHAAFVGGQLAEVAIRVDSTHRDAHVGYRLAKLFIDDCLDRDLMPNWTCDTLNTASYRLAEKLGFEAATSYYLYTSLYTPLLHASRR